MANQDERATVTVEIQGQQANNTLRDLTNQQRRLNAEIRRMAQGTEEFENAAESLRSVNQRIQSIRDDISGLSRVGDNTLRGLQRKSRELTEQIGRMTVGTREYINANRELRQVNDRIQSIRNDMAGLNDVTNNTIAGLENRARQLNEQIRHLPRGTREFTNASRELRQVNSRLAGITTAALGTGLGFRAIFNELKALGTAFWTKFAGVAGIILVLKELFDVLKAGVKEWREFEKSLLNLSSITGAVGSDLKFLSKAAMELGNSVEGGGKAVVEAMKLIAGAKPELLAVKEDLVEVTEKAILLSHAAGMELPDAARRLTDAMNQFKAPAREAGKYVDALAAASKYGAAEVPEVTEALLKFGVSAKSFKVDIFESAAAIEVLAEKGIKGAEAGTMLRNIMTKMSAADMLPKEAQAQLAKFGVDIRKLMDTTTSFADRLTELRKIAGNASAIFKVFGEENKTSGEIILTNIDRLAELTKQVKESGVAAEQAAINLSSLSQKYTNAGNAYDRMSASFSKGTISNSVKGYLDFLTTLMTVASVKMDNMDETRMERELARFRKKIKLMADEEKWLAAVKMRIDLERDVELFKKEKFRYSSQMKRAGEDLQIRAAQLKMLEAAAREAAEKNINLDDSVTSNAVENLGIIAKLQKEIAELTEQRLNSMSEAEIAQLNKTIKLKEEELARLMGKEKHHVDKLRKLYEKLMEDLEKMRRENSKYGLSDRQKEYAEEYQAYEDFKDRIMKDQTMSTEERNDALQVLEENHDVKLRELNKKYFEMEIQDKKQHDRAYLELTNQTYQLELNELKEKYETEIEYFKDNQQKQLELKAQYDEALKQLDEKYKPTPSTTTSTASKWGEYDQQKEAAQEFYNMSKQLMEDRQNLQIQLMEQENQRADEKYRRDTDRERRRYELEELELQKSYDSKKISEAEYNARSADNKLNYERRMAKMEQEKEKREKEYRFKAFKVQQQQSRTNVLMKSGEAIMEIWSKYASAPYIAAAMSGAVAFVTYEQLKMINSAQPPQYAKGGYHDPAGYTNGAGLYSSSTGVPFIAGEAGREYIVPNSLLQNPIIANQVEMIEAARMGRMFAAGGYSTSNTNTTYQNTSSNYYTADNSSLAVAINRLCDHLDSGIGVNYDKFTKTMRSIDESKNSSAIR